MLSEIPFAAMPVYGLKKTDKDVLFLEKLNELVGWHYEQCANYRRIMDADSWQSHYPYDAIEAIPFLPVRLFKEYHIKSISSEQVFKTLTSSGTTSQKVSRISLDKETASYQTKALVYIVQSFLGKQRVPMLIVDHPNVVKDRAAFSARGAGILGLSNFGRDHTYLLDENMEINFSVLEDFLNKYQGEKIFVFGFTFMVWQYLYKALESTQHNINLGNAVLIHSGGWKKLQDQAVDNATFKHLLHERTRISRVHNFYGMVEQVGSVFMECEYGHLHAPAFADVLIRDPKNWQVLNKGARGLIQVLSLLPRSYPGHSLLTEDIGALLGEDDCACGRYGRYFQVFGRVPKAEVRGCSDTHEQNTQAGAPQ